MPKREDSNLRPLRRFRRVLNKQKVTQGTPPPPKDIKNEGRSGRVLENKGLNDNMSEQISGICAHLKPILQKIAGLEGQITVNFGADFVRKFTVTRGARRVVGSLARRGCSPVPSFPRRRESTPQPMGRARRADCIPAFAGMTGDLNGVAFPMTPVPPPGERRHQLIAHWPQTCARPTWTRQLGQLGQGA